MKPEIIAISEDNLFEYLNGREMPVMELDLIKYFIPSGSDNTEQHTLFVRHFSLYHALYKLKFSAGLKGYYLHLDCMRLRLIRIPGTGMCGHYEPETGTFCGSSADGGYCTVHYDGYKNNRHSATFDYLQDFYTDPENITFGESDLLKKILSGVRVYCMKKKDIDSALQFFGIHKPGRNRITKRYRELARQFHPDKCGGSDEMMKKLNSSYAILKEVYIL